MKITPLDIDGQTFRTKMRGYDPQEVRSFLRLLGEEYEKIFAENLKLQEDLTKMESILDEHRERETTLRETLVTAQKLSSDMKEQAQREAELTVKEAEIKADQLLQGGMQRVAELEGSLGEMRIEHDGYLTKVRGLLEHHTKLLEMHEQKATEHEKVQVLARRSAAEVK